MRTKKITLQQLKRLHTLLSKSGLMEEKAAIVAEFSALGATSSRDLTGFEADQLCAWLQQFVPQEYDACNLMRKKMLYYGYLMGYDEPNSPDSEFINADAKDINFSNVNAWCIKHGIYRKPLNELNHEELTHTLSQFLRVYKSTMKSIGK